MAIHFTQEKRKPYKPARKSELTPVADILEPIKKMLGLDEDFFAVMKVWDKEIGINGAEVCGYKDGTIFAQTQYNAVINEILIRKKEIINKLNQYIGSQKIKNIKVTIK